MFGYMWTALTASGWDREDAVMNLKASAANWLGYLTVAAIATLGVHFGGPWKYWAGIALLIFPFVSFFRGIFPGVRYSRRDWQKIYLSASVRAWVILSLAGILYWLILQLHHLFIWLSK